HRRQAYRPDRGGNARDCDREAPWAGVVPMKARMLIAVAALALGAALVFAARPHETSADERADRITTELRWPVCQGLSVNYSTSETARQMRDLVAQRVR